MLACDPKTLAAAQVRAINVELWMKENRPKFMTPRRQRNVRPQYPTSRITEAPPPRLHPPAPVPRLPACEHCKQSGHHQSQCY